MQPLLSNEPDLVWGFVRFLFVYYFLFVFVFRALGFRRRRIACNRWTRDDTVQYGPRCSPKEANLNVIAEVLKLFGQRTLPLGLRPEETRECDRKFRIPGWGCLTSSLWFTTDLCMLSWSILVVMVG